MPSRRAYTLARKLVSILREKAELEAEEEALRAELFKELGHGECVECDGHKVEVYEEERTVLKPTEEIFRLVPRSVFAKIASVTITKIKAVIGKDYSHLVEGYSKEWKLRVREIK